MAFNKKWKPVGSGGSAGEGEQNEVGLDAFEHRFIEELYFSHRLDL